MAAKSGPQPQEEGGSNGSNSKQTDGKNNGFQTRISSDNSPAEGKHTTQTSREDIDRVTIFHQPSKHLLDIKLDSGSTHVSFYLRKTNQVVNLTFKEKFKQEGPRELLANEPEDTVPSMQSIDEMMWKEVKPVNVRKLPNVYMQLAKMRLTGMC